MTKQEARQRVQLAQEQLTHCEKKWAALKDSHFSYTTKQGARQSLRLARQVLAQNLKQLEELG